MVLMRLLIFVAFVLPSGLAMAATEDVIETLIESVESPDEATCHQALLDLANLGPQGATAVPSVCRLLESPDSSKRYLTRVLAVKALVAFGPESVEAARKILESESVLARSCAIQILGQLKALSAADADLVAGDNSARVRSSLAIALADDEKLEPSKWLLPMLADSDAVVSYHACLAIRQRRINTPTMTKAILPVLAREDIAIAAVMILERLGSDARSAVPELLRHSSTLHGYRSFESAAESALNHIGPPSKSDIPQLLELLGHKDVSRTSLVARSLATLGNVGVSAQQRLETTARELIRRAVEIKEKYADAHRNGHNENDNSFALADAATDCIVAHWYVTRDTTKLIELIEHFATNWGEEFSPYNIKPWDLFSKEDIRKLKSLLDSYDSTVVESGLIAIDQLGSKAAVFENILYAKMNSNLAIPRLRLLKTLSSIGPSAAKPFEAELIKAFVKKEIDRQKFASMVMRMRQPPGREVVSILKNGLSVDHDKWGAAACAQALCRFSTTPKETAKLVITKLPETSQRSKIEALIELPEGPLQHSKEAREFLVSCLSVDDVWVKKEAIDAIGQLKPDNIVHLIDPFLKSEHKETQLAAAKTKYLLTSQTEEFDQFLSQWLNKPDHTADQKNLQWNYNLVLKTLAAMKRNGQPFVKHIEAKRELLEWDFAEEIAAALGNIGGQQAKAILKTMSSSKDWLVRTSATNALDKIRHLSENKTEHLRK